MSNPDNHSTRHSSEQAPAGTSVEVAQPDLVAIAHELTEAMQAVTNYVAAAMQVEASSAHSDPRIHEILHKANLQVLRANFALRQLRGHLE
jgi:hypothetical protein